MSLHSVLVEDIGVLRHTVGQEGLYGNPTSTYVSEGPFKGLLSAADSVEVVDRDGNTVLSNLVLTIVAAAGLRPQDRVTKGERVFEVMGDPAPINRPGSPVEAYQARVREVVDVDR